ncbi:IclR family transcriptional regulator [Streptomyces griseoviridis]|jgi:DNA-binding IclR family transcriptional regulator|uniref:DNA-binding IclR family transcriptional regulator n=3 Tax=Streptomyces TaxID=1883 RepID=A0ABT9L7N3_STRGD|nr:MULTISPECIES: IclR family transcriptional regulator [Streptomyces]MDP9679719.1 DNA-binding IclR family transcriptional regulator [Streptomyces griseoviridis]GGS39305.1 IclR family transcriptional regulator [Streptomyces niveoruber]GGS99201.1 IclR family transcriptional regulator [Streptomyces griseoviridis]GGU23238.1 IclR family transcriptional regulator [Streptomyces daghestanicus]GHI29991.1 IclR family transcriptional regulator [Streptomyces daghestanicus]
MANSTSGESVTERIVRILETFGTDRTVQTAAEIGRRAGLPSSTAHRMVAELVDCGLLDRDEEQRVRLGMRLWELALRGSRALRLRQAALPFMEHVQARLREHTQLAVLENDETLFIERLSHPHAGANITRIAGRLPLHASSSGLVLLAHGPEELRERVLAGPLEAVSPETVTDPARLRRLLAGIRRDGVVVAPGTVEAVSTGVAVPVREGRGEVVAALSAVLPRATPTGRAVEELRAAAAGISAAIGAHRP